MYVNSSRSPVQATDICTQMQDILLALQNPQNAGSGLISSVTKFKEDMEECAKLALEIENEFRVLIDTAEEASVAMSHEFSESHRL